MSLFFLSGNQVIYREPTNDSWYQGNRLVQNATDTLDLEPGSSGLYTSREAASPLACAFQVQYCVPSLPEEIRCSPVGSAADSLNYMTNMLHDQQLSKFQWFMASTIDQTLSLSTAITRLGVQLLTSRYRLRNGVQGQLPDNQWQLDVQHWHATTLAHLQGTFVDAATGPRDPALLPWLVKPSTPETQRMCQNQKILSPTHTSISLFYLVLILATGALIILTSYTLDPLLTRLHKPRRHVLDPDTPLSPTAYARAEWTATSALHLQRLAHEAATTPASPDGVGGEGGGATWTRAAATVPVTTGRAQPLAPLDLTDPTHPRLLTTTNTGTGTSTSSPTTGHGPPRHRRSSSSSRDADGEAKDGQPTTGEPKLPEMSFREMSGLEGAVGAAGSRVSSAARSDDATEVSLMDPQDEALPSPLPDYDNWPLPPSGTLTPEGGKKGGSPTTTTTTTTLGGERGRERMRRERPETGLGLRGEGSMI